MKNGPIVKDWNGVNFADPKSRQQVMGALQYFLSERDIAHSKAQAVMQHFRNDFAQIQHLGTVADFPASVLPLIEKYHLSTDYDDAWKMIFDERDFTSSKRNGFEIADVEDGLVFEVIEVGMHAKVHKMSGRKVQVPFEMYGGGLNWHRTLIDDEEYWTLEDNAFAFANKWGAFKANTHYALIDEIPSSRNLAWQAPVPSGLANTDPNYAAIRDVETINTACYQIINACKDLGLGITANSSFVLLAPLALKSRIVRAFGLLNQGLAGQQKGLVYPVTPVFTTGLTSGTSYYICVPKKKTKSGNRMNMKVLDQFDITSYSDIAVGWARFGAAIGDTRCFRRCATTAA